MKFEYNKSKDKPEKGLPKPYNLALPVQNDFARGKERVLVVIEHISSADLKLGGLLKDDVTYQTYSNVFEYAQRIARTHGYKGNARFAFFNFNWLKTYDLTDDLQDTVKKMAADRVKAYVKEMKPTLIIVIGDNAAKAMTKDPDINRKRGLIHKYQGITMVNTVDFDRAYSPPKEGSDNLDDTAVANANILGYVARNIANGFIGRHPFDLKKLKAKYQLINTIKLFDWMMTRLEAGKYIAVDTEGTSLQTVENVFQTFQFAINTRKSYILPIMHKEAPWTAKELEYIKGKLREFFARKMPAYHGPETRYLIGQNFGYDLRMLMKWLNIRYCYWPVWDLMGGEMSLDENIKHLQTMGPSAYNLAQMLLSHNNDFYFTNSVSKADRTNIAEMSLDKPTLRYMAMDAVSAVAIHKMQIARARALEHNGGNYENGQRLLMFNQMSAMVKVMSVMRYRGTQLDQTYLMGLLKPDSIIVGKMEEFTKEFFRYPEVAKADAKIRKDNNIPTGSLFSSGKSDRLIFKLKDKKHLRTLFIDILKLEPLVVGKSGEPSLDKHFMNAYEDNDVVKTYKGLTELKTLKSMFVDAFQKAMASKADSRADGRVRPEFGYNDVVTGRSNSSKPSLQQIPEHTTNAKIVKRMFITAPMCLGYEADFSAHEMRCWGIMSGDSALVQTFRRIHAIIVKNRLKFFHKGRMTEKQVEAHTNASDAHKQNYAFFAQKDVQEVTKPERQEAKNITFGGMYGEGPGSLAAKLKYTLEKAKEIQTAFFGRFPKAKKYLEWTVSFSGKHLYVFNFLQRRRNLFGYLSGHPSVVASMQRRAQNSPIQGLASEVCYIAAELFCKALHECFEKLGVEHDSYAKATTAKLTHLPTGPNVQVHDSLKGEAHIEHLLLTIHLLEWAMTVGVKDHIEEVFGQEINTPFDVEVEIGAAWSLKTKWDWSAEGLKEAVIKAIEWHKEIHPKDKEVQALDPEKTYAKMQKIFAEQKKILKLDKKYPLNLEIMK